MVRTLILGAGEIGKSLAKVLEKNYDVTLFDRGNFAIGSFDFMHVCFPFSKIFVRQVKAYQRHYQPRFTIIHSTVPVGTSRKVSAWHSPVIGIHPFLQESLITFTKFLGGPNNGELIQYFRRAGIKVYPTDEQENTELLKVLCTTKYGLDIEFNKEVKRLCDKNKVPFELWTLWTNNYNEGYVKLNCSEYVRPNLVPMNGKIGGHCVISNLDFLDSRFAKFLKELNK